MRVQTANNPVPTDVAVHITRQLRVLQNIHYVNMVPLRKNQAMRMFACTRKIRKNREVNSHAESSLCGCN
jgi:hypothetical protein